jgi:RNA polymerase sigma factor (TIGR02999 family)
MSDVTRILNQIESGDPSAAEQLLPLVYNELRKLAAAKLAHEKPGQTLQATALVHEAYLRLLGSNGQAAEVTWNGRGHFFGAAAEAMRRILVDSARKKNSIKHGGQMHRTEFDGERADANRGIDLIVLDDLIDRLAEQDTRKAELVKLRYFAGMTLSEAASVLGISETTASADWAYAKAWLKVRLRRNS